MINYLRFKFIRHCLSFLLMFSISNSCNDTPKIGDAKQTISIQIGTTVPETDAELLVEVAEISLKEIKLGQLAQRNGQTTDVRELGKRFEKAHGRYLETLKELAKKKLTLLPLTPSKPTQQLFEMLQKTPKSAFDKAYCDQTVAAHQAAIRKFEAIVRDNNDADIKKWAGLTLKDLQVQLLHAEMHNRKLDKKKGTPLTQNEKPRNPKAAPF